MLGPWGGGAAPALRLLLPLAGLFAALAKPAHLLGQKSPIQMGAQSLRRTEKPRQKPWPHWPSRSSPWC